MASDAALRRIRDEVVADGVFLAVRLDTAEGLVEACRAAVRGGLRVIEVTLTTPGALAAIRALADDGNCLPGAGTVLEVDRVRAVAEAGGRFAMSPVFDPDVVRRAHRLGLLAVPGAGSATEILAAHRCGALLVKVFPAGPLGGPDFLRKVRGPLPDIPLVPTSGPTVANVADYLDAGAVAVGMGSEVFPAGFTPQSVEAAARRVREAMDAARTR